MSCLLRVQLRWHLLTTIWWRTSGVLILITTGLGGAYADGLGGGAGSPGPASRADVSDQDRLRVAEQLLDFTHRFGSLSNRTGRDLPPLFPVYPMGGTLYGDLFINNFADLDPGPGLLDWDCTGFTYNGHDASDVDLRSFGEQAIGVPVFAALDGTVVATHDGEFDMNVCPGSPCNPNSNYVIIDHGSGRLCYYWHLKQWSVAVSPGEQVVTGQQIGLAASSGNSSQTGPGAGVLACCRPGDADSDEDSDLADFAALQLAFAE